ncbi:MAG: Na+:solute symporter [Verrucomicrobiae bacterium]|nr:Na+:solute symporter [Verrucomicrobiae bacterium]
MDLTALDWIIIAAYMLFALGIGIYYSKRASESSEEYYLAGRSLPWWVVGTSIVATTFAADTPLAITEMSRAKGIWENWFWWSWLLYGLLAIFLFSRLWRRARVLTENELIELRYSGKPAAFLRAFKAGYFAILYNFIVLGWVIKGMSSVLTVMLGLPKDQTQWVIIALVVLTVVYCLMSGFWGVVMTDLVQFVIAMVGAIALAFVALNAVGGIDGLKTRLDQVLPANAARMDATIAEKKLLFSQLQGSDRVTALSTYGAETDEMIAEAASFTGDKQILAQRKIDARIKFIEEQTGTEGQMENGLDSFGKEIEKLEARRAELPENASQILSLTPEPPPGFKWNSPKTWITDDFLGSGFFEFLVFLTILWWSNHSADGGGYTVQRTMAAKDERHAFGANLWYNFACFALRTWPWIIVALVSIVLFPNISDIEDVAIQDMGDKAGYPLVMREVLGSGLRGLLVVSFLAAFMSTVDTHLNWASSYLINDIYRRFLKPASQFKDKQTSEKHYIMVSRILVIILTLIAAIVSLYIDRIEGAWKFVIAMGSGIGLVLILRWFWWRINAWSEIVALSVSVIMAVGFEVLAKMEHGGDYKVFVSQLHLFGILFTKPLQLMSIVIVSLLTWIPVTFLTKPTDKEKLKEFFQRVQPGGWWSPVQSETIVTHAPVARGFILNFVAGIALVWGAMFSIGYLIFKEWVPGIALGAVALAGWWWIWRFTIVPMKTELTDGSQSESADQT